MKKTYKYKQKQFSNIVSPLRTWNIDSMNCIGIYQYITTYAFPRIQENVLYLFDKVENQYPKLQIATRYHINDVLHIKESKYILIATGDYDGGMYFEGELLLWNTETDSFKSLINGRQINKCNYNENNEIQIIIFPEHDQCPPDEFVDSTYILPYELNSNLELQELELVKKEPHENNYNPINNYFESAAEEISVLSKGQWNWQGYIQNIEHFDNLIIATFENYGILIFDEQLNKIKEIPLGLGSYIELIKANNKLYIHRTSSKYKNFSRELSHIYEFDKSTFKIFEICNWDYSRVNITNDRILMASTEYYKSRKNDVKLIQSKSSSTYNFSEKTPTIKPVQDLEAKRCFIIKSQEYDDFPVSKLVELTNKKNEIEILEIKDFLPSNSRIISSIKFNKFLIYGTRIEKPREHHPTSLRMYNLKSKNEIWTIDFEKDNFLDIRLMKHEGIKIFCLTNQNEIEVYDIENGELKELFDFNEYTNSNFLSFTIEKSKIYLGDSHGNIISTNLKDER